MRNIIEKIKLIYRRFKVKRICKDIDWGKRVLLLAQTEEQERLARNYIDICYYELLDLDIN